MGLNRRSTGVSVALAIGVVGCAAPGCSAPDKRQADGPASQSTTAARFGELEGTTVQLYTLTNRHGLVARITNYGAIVTELHVPDRAGALADVVLGFETLDGYVKGTSYFGAIVGRAANRIANAAFTLDGTRYALAANDGPHHLHGGRRGWDKVVWSATPRDTADGPALERFGENGRIVLPNPWIPGGERHGTATELTVLRDGRDPEHVLVHTEHATYAIEAELVLDSVPAPEAPWPAMTHADTLGNMRVLDRWQAALGVTSRRCGASTPAHTPPWS